MNGQPRTYRHRKLAYLPRVSPIGRLQILLMIMAHLLLNSYTSLQKATVIVN